MTKKVKRSIANNKRVNSRVVCFQHNAQDKDGAAILRIGDGMDATTKYFELREKISPLGEVLYVIADCAGVGDTRGIWVEISNALSLQQLFQTSKRGMRYQQSTNFSPNMISQMKSNCELCINIFSDTHGVS